MSRILATPGNITKLKIGAYYEIYSGLSVTEPHICLKYIHTCPSITFILKHRVVRRDTNVGSHYLYSLFTCVNCHRETAIANHDYAFELVSTKDFLVLETPEVKL